MVKRSVGFVICLLFYVSGIKSSSRAVWKIEQVNSICVVL
jgi:hypothetical protein